jgi:DNA-binding GntR family transcriptional regulator
MDMSTPVVRSIVDAHRTFAGLAESSIRDMILDGRLAPGVRINEVELAGALGISRGPLREAIQRMASQGLVTIKSHRGAFVKVVELRELRELYELRIALEGFAVRLVAAQGEPAQVDALSELLDETRELLAGDTSQPYPLDSDFHRQIVGICGNAAIRDAHERTLQQISLARARSAHNPKRAQQALSEHDLVLQAVVDRDADRAAKALEAHLWSSLSSAEEILATKRDVSDI